MQRPALASSLAVPPPVSSRAEAVDLSAGAATLEDPGPAAAPTAAAVAAAGASTRAGFLPDSRCLLVFICSRLCSGRGGNIISIYWRRLRWSIFLLVVFVTCIKFSFSHLCL